MKIKTLSVGIIVAATTMVFAVGPTQASCYKKTPGWHMVSKKCHIKPATNWQEYDSGVYIQPQTGKGLF